MFILFVRSIILYFLLLVVLRLTGKRQMSDLQPFDLIMSLLIADLASLPASDTGVPLLYGIVPILSLFLIHRLMSYASLKNERIRSLICGSPIVLIKDGVVQQAVLRDAHYSISDLIAQLRTKDVFELNSVAFAILETNGELSVLLKGDQSPLTRKDLSLPAEVQKPPFLLLSDGKPQPIALKQAGKDITWLKKTLAALAGTDFQRYLFLLLLADGSLYGQTKEAYGAKVLHLPSAEKENTP